MIPRARVCFAFEVEPISLPVTPAVGNYTQKPGVLKAGCTEGVEVGVDFWKNGGAHQDLLLSSKSVDVGGTDDASVVDKCVDQYRAHFGRGKGNGGKEEREQEAGDAGTGAGELVSDERRGIEIQSWSGSGHGPLCKHIYNCKGPTCICHRTDGLLNLMLTCHASKRPFLVV